MGELSCHHARAHNFNLRKEFHLLALKTCALSQIFSLLSQIFVSSVRFNASSTDIFSSRLPPSLRAQTALCSSLRYARKPVGSACGFFLLSLGLQLDRRLATFPANRTTASERVRLSNSTECACDKPGFSI